MSWPVVCGWKLGRAFASPKCDGLIQPHVYLVMAKAMVGLRPSFSSRVPRISCRGWLRSETSCGFPLKKAAHAVLSRAACRNPRYAGANLGHPSSFRPLFDRVASLCQPSRPSPAWPGQDLPVVCANPGSRQSILTPASSLRQSHAAQDRPWCPAETLFPCARPHLCS